MAHKRMFSKDITGSDAFREMPTSSQALYFHLGMEADDDGFLDNYKGLMRSVNATDDDLRILLSKRFLILFPSKVVVIKHWLINNTIRKDRYNETKHLEEKRALIVKENGSYTELSSGIPSGNQVATQYRIEENRKDTANADSIQVIQEDAKPPKPRKDTENEKIARWWYRKCQEYFDRQPVAPLTKAMRIVGDARKKLTNSQLREMMENHIEDSSLEEADRMQITQALSNYKIDKYLANV